MIDLKTAPHGILALRVTTGALFLFHGLVKLFVFTPAGTAGYFESIGLPGALGYLTMLVEIALISPVSSIRRISRGSNPFSGT